VNQYVVFSFHSKNTVVNRATTCLFPFLSSFKSAFTIMKAQSVVCRDSFDELTTSSGSREEENQKNKNLNELCRNWVRVSSVFDDRSCMNWTINFEQLNYSNYAPQHVLLAFRFRSRVFQYIRRLVWQGILYA
jgi:hypothetical protein